MPQVSVSTCLADAQGQLDASDSPRLDAELLLAHALEKSRTWLFTWPDALIDDRCYLRFTELLERRKQGEPIAYLIGERGFWNLDLFTTPDTLIPRPDTEVLVEQALARMPLGEDGTVLDMGTGTGAVALALASERPSWKITGVDIVPAAVALARRNQVRHGLSNVQFIQSDWFESVGGRFDLIVSNPPYIEAGDKHLRRGDVRFEPLTALVSGSDGLTAIRSLVAGASPLLSPRGTLLLEHGYNQAASVTDLFLGAGFQNVVTYKDYGGNPRVTLGTLAVR